MHGEKVIAKACNDLAKEMQGDVPKVLLGDEQTRKLRKPEKKPYRTGRPCWWASSKKVETWYQKLSEEEKINFRNDHKVSVEEIDVRKNPFRFLEETSSFVLLVPKDRLSLWLAQLLRTVYGIGEIAASKQEYDDLKRTGTDSGFLWILDPA